MIQAKYTKKPYSCTSNQKASPILPAWGSISIICLWSSSVFCDRRKSFIWKRSYPKKFLSNLGRCIGYLRIYLNSTVRSDCVPYANVLQAKLLSASFVLLSFVSRARKWQRSTQSNILERPPTSKPKEESAVTNGVGTPFQLAASIWITLENRLQVQRLSPKKEATSWISREKMRWWMTFSTWRFIRK